ncbi:putative nuclease HARBI1 [Ochlerotatus camptorhynchus]|uniref:putative nuclease HARBI1 n=1 Tax=Ochlerotatus camptorhynchus TaxID=644619 RepID=UPI0031D3F785
MDSIALACVVAEEETNALRKLRNNLRKKTNVMELPDAEFMKNFRLNKEAFEYVLHEIEEELPPSKHGGLSARDKLIACLRFFAEGSYQHGAGKDYDIAIAQPTFSKVLGQMLVILERKICPKWITLVMSDEEMREAKLYFYRKSTIPGIIMCVDGTHVKIIPPKKNRNLFYNRKGFYSLNVLIVMQGIHLNHGC